MSTKTSVKLSVAKVVSMTEAGKNAELRAMGVTPGGAVDEQARAVLFPLEVAPGEVEYWLGLQNFYTVTRYNKSTLYAMAAHQLADAIRQRRQPGAQ